MKEKKLILSMIIVFIMLLIGMPNTYASTSPFHNFTSLYLETTNAKIGDKVYIDFYGNTKEFYSVKLELVYEEKSTIVEIKDLESKNPYFIVPEEINTGVTYEMISIIAECEHGITTYSTIKGNDNFTNCFNKKYLTIEKKDSDLQLTCLSLASHYVTMEDGDKLWLDVEIKGKDPLESITMVIRNKENPEISALLPLRKNEYFQYIDIMDAKTQANLENGTYYISDVYINPTHEDYIRYSLDETAENARKLEFNVEFKIKNNPLHLSNLSLASHYTIIKPTDRLWLDVEIKGKGTVGLVTMIIRNKENPEISALLSLKEDNCLQYIDMMDTKTQAKLEDGTYYISDLYINPNEENYIRYTLDECADNARLLKFYVEFEIKSEEEKTENSIIDNNEENIKENINNKNNDSNYSENNNVNDNKNNDKTNNNNTNNSEENKNSNIDNNKTNNHITNNDKDNMNDDSINDNISNDKAQKNNNIKNEKEKINEDVETTPKSEHDETVETKESLDKKIYNLLLKLIELLTLRKSL